MNMRQGLDMMEVHFDSFLSSAFAVTSPAFIAAKGK